MRSSSLFGVVTLSLLGIAADCSEPEDPTSLGGEKRDAAPPQIPDLGPPQDESDEVPPNSAPGLDPRRVYLRCTVAAGDNELPAGTLPPSVVFDPLSSRAPVGFLPSSLRDPALVGDELYYLVSTDVRDVERPHASVLRKMRTDAAWSIDPEGHLDALDNDPLVDTPCIIDRGGSGAFAVDASGAFYYACGRSDAGFMSRGPDGEAFEVCGGFPPIAVHEDGTLLCLTNPEGLSVWAPEGSGFKKLYADFDRTSIARARPGGGFWLARRVGLPTGELSPHQRWRIDGSGLHFEGEYPAASVPGTPHGETPRRVSFDAEGALYFVAIEEHDETSILRVVRGSADFTSTDVIFDGPCPGSEGTGNVELVTGR